MHRQLTQAGMNRAIWHMLRALKGRFTISFKQLQAVDPNIAIRVDHIESTDTFVLSLQRLNDMAKDNSVVIDTHNVDQPGQESNIIKPN